MTPVGAWTAFRAGLLGSLSPSIALLLPVLACVGIMGGGKERGRSAHRVRSAAVAALFVAGLLAVFAVLASGHSAAGAALLARQRFFMVLGGAYTMAFGGLWSLRAPEYRPEAPNPAATARGSLGFVLAGAAFGFAWSPATGPVLGDILLALASDPGSRGLGPLGLYALGLGLTLWVFCVGLGQGVRALPLFQRHGVGFQRAAGVFLALAGAAVAAGLFTRLSDQVSAFGEGWIDWLNQKGL